MSRGMRLKVLTLTSLSGNIPDPRRKSTLPLESSDPYFCVQTLGPWELIIEILDSLILIEF